MYRHIDNIIIDIYIYIYVYRHANTFLGHILQMIYGLMFLNVSDCQLLLIKRLFMERSVAVGSALVLLHPLH